MPPDGWQGVRRLLLVAPGTGDAVAVIQSGPALRALRGALPGVTITLLAAESGAETGCLLPGLEEVLAGGAIWSAEPGAQRSDDPARERALVDLLRGRRFDAAVILPDGTYSPHPAAYACYLAGIPIRLGASMEFGGGVLSHRVKPATPPTDSVSASLALLQGAGFVPAGGYLDIAVPQKARATVDDLLAGSGLPAGMPFVLVAAPPAGERPAMPCAALLDLLRTETGLPIVDIAACGELCDGLVFRATRSNGEGAESDPSSIFSVAKWTWPLVAAFVERACLVVTSHPACLILADALARPVVAWGRAAAGRLWSAPARLIESPIDRPNSDALRIVEAAADLLDETADASVPTLGTSIPSDGLYFRANGATAVATTKEPSPEGGQQWNDRCES